MRRQPISVKTLNSFFSKFEMSILIKFSPLTVNLFSYHPGFFLKIAVQIFEKIAV